MTTTTPLNGTIAKQNQRLTLTHPIQKIGACEALLNFKINLRTEPWPPCFRIEELV